MDPHHVTLLQEPRMDKHLESVFHAFTSVSMNLEERTGTEDEGE